MSKELSDLALSVINTGSHYAQRVEKYRKLMPRLYLTYIRGLVEAEASAQRVKFDSRWNREDVRVAADQVVNYMRDQVAEMDDAAHLDKLGARALQLLSERKGEVLTTPEALKRWGALGWEQQTAAMAEAKTLPEWAQEGV